MAPVFRDFIVDRHGIERHGRGQGRQASVTDSEIRGCEHSRPKFTDRDDRHGQLIGQRRCQQRPSRLSGDENRCVGESAGHAVRSSVVSGTSARSSASKAGSA